jgi:hypothetical protein
MKKDNLNSMIVKYASLQKEAFIGTALSALLHGAAADDDEPMLREVLRGAVKGMGADAGWMLGGLAGGFGGGAIGNLIDGNNSSNIMTGGALGAGLGIGAGGVGGYLLADKLVNRIGRKDKKAPAKLQT